MPVALPNFIGGAYQLRAVDFDSQRCINLYPVADQKMTGKNGGFGYLQGTPGKSLFSTLGSSGNIRGMYTTSGGDSYAVSGGNLYSVSSSGVSTNIGALLTGSGTVNFSYNGAQLLIVDGAYGYIYTKSSGVFAQITDPNFPPASHAAFIDGYFIVNEVGTDRFWFSTLYDGFTWGESDFASAEGSPDNLLAITSLREQLWCFGAKTVQVFYDSGDSYTPFIPINGVFIHIGCIAKHTIVKVADTLAWLGANDDGYGSVYIADGYQAKAISTNAIDYAIQQDPSPSTATAFAYQQDGATFYCLNLSTRSFAYDASTNEWHERAYFSNGQFSRDIAENHIMIGKNHYVGSYTSNVIYKLDLDYYFDGTQQIKRLRSCPHISKNLDMIYYDKLQLDFTGGVGITSGQGSNPQVMMRYSNDGGNTYQSERTQSLGLTGNYTNRVVFLSCGASRSRVFEVSITDPVKVNLLGAYIEASAGRS